MPAVQCSEVEVEQYVFDKENKESETGNGKTNLPYQDGKSGQLNE